MKPDFVKRAFIYRLGDLILINPVARTRHGLGVGLPEVIAVHSHNPELVGKEVLNGLDKSFDDLGDESVDTKASLKSILSITRIRSWRTFHNKAKLVVAYRFPRTWEIRLTPTRSDGNRGSEHLDQKQRTSSMNSDELGRNVLAALDDAE